MSPSPDITDLAHAVTQVWFPPGGSYPPAGFNHVLTLLAKAAAKWEEAGERTADLHRKINQDVSDALGQDITQSWHDLGAKVLALKAERDDLRRQLALAAVTAMHAALAQQSYEDRQK